MQPQSQSPHQPADLRRVLGSFATGVTIVTARSPEGRALGVTANSFNSVSLDPPLVLWSLARRSSASPVFQATRHWTVHILAENQRALSDLFARPGVDRFRSLAHRNGLGDVPLLEDCAARLQCEAVACHDGGDHIILVGRVLDCERREVPPLVFHGGRYASLALVENGQAA